MNKNRIIRDIEISKITGDNLDGDSKLVVDFFDDLLSKIVLKTYDDEPDSSLYFLINDKVIMEQNYKKDILWSSYDKVWSFFENKIKLDYRETQELIKYTMEQYLKYRISFPVFISPFKTYFVEQHLKNRVSIPIPRYLDNLSQDEDHLKNRVSIKYY